MSTPNRLIIVFEGLDKEVKILSQEIKGPKVGAPEQALEGFAKSNKIEPKDLFKKKTEKGDFYFYKTKTKILKTSSLLVEFIPKLLESYNWKKSMKWGDFNINWGRPLKSILAVFDEKTINFEFHHIISSNSTFIDKDFEDKSKLFKDYKSYKKYFQNNGTILSQNKRKEIINREFKKILDKKN